jgi:hypothetical protein
LAATVDRPGKGNFKAPEKPKNGGDILMWGGTGMCVWSGHVEQQSATVSNSLQHSATVSNSLQQSATAHETVTFYLCTLFIFML